MAQWGTEWGLDNPWGGAAHGAFALEDCETAKCHLLMQHRGLSTENLLKLACIIGKLFGKVRDEAKDVENAFDLDDAVGDQLDKIGSTVGLPRNALTDTEYRKFLNIQILLILESTGTGENILSILRTFIGPSINPIVIVNSPPYGFSVSSLDITPADWDALVPIVRKALIAAVMGIVLAGLPGSLTYDSIHPGAPITGTGVYDSTHAGAPIAGAGVYGFSIII